MISMSDNRDIDMVTLLQSLTSEFGLEIYNDKQRLFNLISDLYSGEEKWKRLYEKAIKKENLTLQIYALNTRPVNERKGMIEEYVTRFAKNNFIPDEISRKIVYDLAYGMFLLLNEVTTEVNDDDGRWTDEYGAVYSADKRKLIRVPAQLKEYSILNGTLVICDECFGFPLWRKPSNIQCINMPNSIISIGSYAFYGCASLQKINLSNNLKSIGKLAFMGCISLRQLSIPNSVNSLGNGIFSGCDLLDLKINAERFKCKDRILYSAEGCLISCFSTEAKIVLSDIICSIADYAFFCCKHLKRIELSKNIASIGDYAFASCESLRSIELPDSIKEIGNDAFVRCESLESVKFGSSINEIGSSAFCACKQLSSIIIPKSVKILGHGVFSGCSSLSTIDIPYGLTKIPDNAFADCSSLHEVEIPSSVTEIGASAFENCTSLATITIPDSVTEIGWHYPFSWCICTSLKKIRTTRKIFEKFRSRFPKDAQLQEL